MMTEDEFKFAVNMVLNHFGQETKAAYNVRTGVGILMTEREALRQRVKELEFNCEFLSTYKERIEAELAALKQESNGYRFSAENNYRLYTDLIAELNKLKAGQGEPVAEVVDGDLGPRLVWSFFDVKAQVGTKLYTSAPTIPEGWQLVPIEPTEEMGDVGAAYNFDGFSAVGIYKAMLDAAPKPEEKS